MDFYPPENAATSEYYLDNFTFTKLSGESAPVLSVDPESIYAELDEDDMASFDITIAHDGNTIGDYVAWIDFGQTQGGSQNQVINYDNDPSENTSLVGLNVEEPTLIEVGAVYSAASYAGAVMGTNITKAQYFFGESQDGGIGIEPNTSVTFRIYGQGLYGQYGEIIVSKVVH